eukprot:CFRG3608T1
MIYLRSQLALPIAIIVRRRLLQSAAGTSLGNAHISVKKIQKPTFDFKKISANPAKLLDNAKARNAKDADPLLVSSLYAQQCSLIAQVNSLREKRNDLTHQLKQLSSPKNKSDPNMPSMRHALVQESSEIKSKLGVSEAELTEITKKLFTAAANIPNDTHPCSPVGPEENAVTVALKGKKQELDFKPKDHVELGRALDMFDFETASAVSGHAFYYLKNAAARLELALIQYAVDFVSDRGFMVVTTPDTYCLEQPYEHLCLSGTAEIPLGGLFMGKTFTASELPIKVVAFGRAFRAEAGAYGAANKGLYRVHQFSKVEMFVVSSSETVKTDEGDMEATSNIYESDILLEELRVIQEDFLESLGLHFRVLDMPTAELGASAYRKYDVEAYMPGRAISSDILDDLAYGEVTSASNCTDFQSRRLGIRYKAHQSAPTMFAHTLNGTACAVPRVMIALLETHQNEDGTISVPEALQSYMRCSVIEPPASVM